MKMIIDGTKMELMRQFKDCEDFRNKAIEMGWFTMANCEEYEEFFIECNHKYLSENAFHKAVYRLAKTVVKYSDWSGYEDYSEHQIISNVMFFISSQLVYNFYEFI